MLSSGMFVPLKLKTVPALKINDITVCIFTLFSSLTIVFQLYRKKTTVKRVVYNLFHSFPNDLHLKISKTSLW